MKKVLLFSLVLLVIAAAVLGFIFLRDRNVSESVRYNEKTKLDCRDVAKENSFPSRTICVFLNRQVHVFNFEAKLNTDRLVYCGHVSHEKVAIYNYKIFYLDDKFHASDELDEVDQEFINQLKMYIGDNYYSEVPTYDSGKTASCD